MIGARLPRREDSRLVRGAGCYVGDLRVTNCLDAAFVRSQVAHGRRRAVDLEAARQVPGVAAAWSHEDLPFLSDTPPMMNPEAAQSRRWPPLATDRVRYVGEPLAIIVAADRVTYGPDGRRQDAGMEVFVASYAPRPHMLVFGAVDFAAALARQGAFLDYRVTVCDARPVFATPARFPAADDVVVDWPDRYLAAQAAQGAIDSRTVVCVLTNDPKFDIPVLRLDVGYVGAIGSRQTHHDRLDQLRAAGLTDAELSRLASPIGLDLGARTPEETAVSIAAEIIARRRGGGGHPLTEAEGRIHRATS